MKKNLLFVIFIIFTITVSINSYASYEGHGENLGREGPPPAGPYRLGYKELERAIKTEKKGKIKNPPIPRRKYENGYYNILGNKKYFVKDLLKIIKLNIPDLKITFVFVILFEINSTISFFL